MCDATKAYLSDAQRTEYCLIQVRRLAADGASLPELAVRQAGASTRRMFPVVLGSTSPLPYLSLGASHSRVSVVDDPGELLQQLHRGVLTFQLRSANIARIDRDVSSVVRL
jgi:hypothetical protein